MYRGPQRLVPLAPVPHAYSLPAVCSPGWEAPRRPRHAPAAWIAPLAGGTWGTEGRWLVPAAFAAAFAAAAASACACLVAHAAPCLDCPPRIPRCSCDASFRGKSAKLVMIDATKLTDPYAVCLGQFEIYINDTSCALTVTPAAFNSQLKYKSTVRPRDRWRQAQQRGWRRAGQQLRSARAHVHSCRRCRGGHVQPAACCSHPPACPARLPARL